MKTSTKTSTKTTNKLRIIVCTGEDVRIFERTMRADVTAESVARAMSAFSSALDSEKAGKAGNFLALRWRDAGVTLGIFWRYAGVMLAFWRVLSGNFVAAWWILSGFWSGFVWNKITAQGARLRLLGLWQMSKAALMSKIL